MQKVFPLRKSCIFGRVLLACLFILHGNLRQCVAENGRRGCRRGQLAIILITSGINVGPVRFLLLLLLHGHGRDGRGIFRTVDELSHLAEFVVD